jgi:hypothetical protein
MTDTYKERATMAETIIGTTEDEQMRAEFKAWVQDRGCDTDGAWSAWCAAWNRRAGTGWLSIESAPKDGTEILIWREDCGVLMGRYCSANELSTMSDKERDELDEVSLFQEDWWGGDADGGGYRLEGSELPTHWLPLPLPPSPESKQ